MQQGKYFKKKVIGNRQAIQTSCLSCRQIRSGRSATAAVPVSGCRRVASNECLQRIRLGIQTGTRGPWGDEGAGREGRELFDLSKL